MIGALLLGMFSGMLAGVLCLLLGYGFWIALISYSVIGMIFLLGASVAQKFCRKTQKTKAPKAKLAR
ncbi:hypothetical protein [Ruegeria sp. ANG-S4]|uniref:hypothetical protein n=1 Tax=Ruegeria sp. ANG-S4 TaxID=1577904 RepID=UPI00126A535D|nr:hypothetical protein [Ruegeria sp. ANG-S4]